MERLDKVLAAASEFSRREVKELVRRGSVCVDGITALSAEMKVDPNRAVITVKGEVIACSDTPIYVLLHKPAGVVSATEDAREKTVLDILPAAYRKRALAPVGRLDKDTEGLLLLTDDGELNHYLTSPRRHVEKEYFARVDGVLTQEDVQAFADGIILSDFTCRSAKLEILRSNECLVTVQEGKFHQVRRMLAKCGKPVTYLKRLRIGPLSLPEDLPCGASRLLILPELELLERAVGVRSFCQREKK